MTHTAYLPPVGTAVRILAGEFAGELGTLIEHDPSDYTPMIVEPKTARGYREYLTPYEIAPVK
jgi:hypothetical protein